MQRGPLLMTLFLIPVLLVPGGLHLSALAVQTLYWCPNRPADQQYSATAEPGCKPLRDEAERKEEGRERPAPSPIAIENFQTEVTGFLHRYRTFLACCALEDGGIEQATRLEDEASAIVEAAQTKLFSEQLKLRGFTYRELLPPLAKARDDLRQLKTRLKALADSKRSLHTLDYESAGRERRRIQEEEDAIVVDIRASAVPESARTGTEISETTLPHRVGAQHAEDESRTGAAIGATTLSPLPGPEAATSLPTRNGTEAADTTLKSATGFEAGAAVGPTGDSTNPMRVGPAIGDSPFNRR